MNIFGILVQSTRDSPHETREANSMRTHHHLPVLHYELDNRGVAVIT